MADDNPIDDALRRELGFANAALRGRAAAPPPQTRLLGGTREILRGSIAPDRGLR